MKIILATINARYSHCSFGLRYLKANLKEYEKNTEISEYVFDDRIVDIAEDIISKKPDYVGFGCYIWNIDSIIKICEVLQKVAPKIKIILGGPEVSYEYDEFLPFCDYLIIGEGELSLYEIIKNRPEQKIISQPVCDLSQIKMPYYLYTEEDIKNRIIYVESSRGCPFSCEFCLSSLSKGIRNFDLDTFLKNIKMLIEKGVKHFKFVDRTFNLDTGRIKKILNFFKENWQAETVLHFEIFPDKLNAKMLEEIKNFPDNGLHLEAGVQTFYEPSLKAISRKQDEEKTLKNIKYITEETKQQIHADLVLGLPHSNLKTIEEDFNKIMSVNPQELQIGILKKLRGAPISRHDESFQMVYSKHPPYEILQNKDISFDEFQKLKRLARYFDLFYNSGIFKAGIKSLKTFKNWIDFSEFIWQNYNQTYKISRIRQQEILTSFLEKQNK